MSDHPRHGALADAIAEVQCALRDPSLDRFHVPALARVSTAARTLALRADQLIGLGGGQLPPLAVAERVLSIIVSQHAATGAPLTRQHDGVIVAALREAAADARAAVERAEAVRT